MYEGMSLIIGYLFGCFLTAVVVVKLSKGMNVFEIGSHNPGMANVMANVGKKEGALVLIGDILKTVLALLICWILFSEELGHDVLLWSGMGVLLGHNFPFWHKFNGGKGVAVSCTVLIIAMPVWGTIACVVGGIITIATAFLSLGAVLIPLFAIPFAFWQLGLTGGIFICIMEVIMLLRHFKDLKIAKKESWANKKSP